MKNPIKLILEMKEKRLEKLKERMLDQDQFPELDFEYHDDDEDELDEMIHDIMENLQIKIQILEDKNGETKHDWIHEV